MTSQRTIIKLKTSVPKNTSKRRFDKKIGYTGLGLPTRSIGIQVSRTSKKDPIREKLVSHWHVNFVADFRTTFVRVSHECRENIHVW